MYCKELKLQISHFIQTDLGASKYFFVADFAFINGKEKGTISDSVQDQLIGKIRLGCNLGEIQQLAIKYNYLETTHQLNINRAQIIETYSVRS